MSETYPALVIGLVALLTLIGFIPIGEAFEGHGEHGPVSGEVENPFGGQSDPALGERQDEEACITHPPIHIEDDERFRSPGSGVVNPRAEGTQGDPFIIEGWCITSAPNPLHPGVGVLVDLFHDLRSSFVDVDTTGILIKDTSAHVIIRNNLISQHTVGFDLENVENARIERNTITDNGRGFAFVGPSVLLTASTNNTVQDNIISDNGREGVRIVSSGDNIVQNNTITGNEREGVRLSSSDDNIVQNNTITDNGREGVRLSSSDDNTVQDNTITDNGWGFASGGPSVGLSSSENNTIRGNIITDNIGHGVSSDSTNIVEDNTITGNGGTGVELAGDGSVVRDNTITENAWDGVFLSSSSGNTVQGNTVTGNGGGVFLSSSNGNTVQGNTVSGNGWLGLFLGSSSANAVQGNTISNNGGDGIPVWGTSEGNQVTGNVITENGANGILLTENLFGDVPSGSIIEGNNIRDNADQGLYVVAHEGAVQATDNWWGASSGPSGGEEDACTGVIADGDGDGIRTDGADACFDPWLGSYIEDAGAE